MTELKLDQGSFRDREGRVFYRDDRVFRALSETAILKDSSSYNVQWKGTRPTFIDISSFEEWKDGDPWVGYLQFCQLFLYPLMLTAYRNVAFHPWLHGSLDGRKVPECAPRMACARTCRPWR